MRRLSLLALLVLALGGLSLPVVRAARSERAQHQPRPAAAPTAELPDPGQPGPFAVGVTHRTFTRPSSTNGQARVLDTVIWYPAAAAGTPDVRLGGTAAAPPDRAHGPYPVVLFSHGSGGQPWQSTFFTAHLASQGFVVVAPPHPGNTTSDCLEGCLGGGMSNRLALVDSALNRPPDIIAAFDGAAGLSAGGDPILGGLLDPARAGVTGHSFGALTSIFGGGRDDRFRAVVPMASPALPAVIDEAKHLRVPTLLMAGGEDGLAPLSGVQSIFDALPADGAERWLLTFPRGGHFAYANLCPPVAAGCGPNGLPQSKAHTLINRWATAFLLTYVASDARYAPLLDPAAAQGDPDVQVAVGPGG